MSEKKKDQLHQILAVESDRKTAANVICDETINTFRKKQEHFDGLLKTYQPYDDKGYKFPPESKQLSTTVADKVRYTQKSVINAVDTQITKEETNCSGTVKAELVVDGTSFGEFSATSLLALSQHLKKIFDVYQTIPTLDPTKVWELDEAEGKNRFKTQPEMKYRTEKEMHVLVKAPATKEHPAQTETYNKDVQVGEYTTVYKSGKITVAQKSELLARVKKLIDAVKRARSKANQAETLQQKIGKKLFDFIDGSVFK